MRLSRFFIDQSITPGDEVSLPANLVNYISRVLRLAVGDNVILFKGDTYQDQAGEFLCRITHVDKRHVSVLVEYFMPRTVESPLRINLLQGISRGERMDYTIQKAVELGVSMIYPVFTERANVKLNAERMEKKLGHWQAIANSACEQCGRTVQVGVAKPLTLAQVSSIEADLNLVLSPIAAVAARELKPAARPQSVNLLIGPEGGLSEDETEHVIRRLCYQALKLGPRILRTETAGVAALSLMQYLWGDF